MPDYYATFAELSRHEIEGIDYRIRVIDRSSRIVVVAPHGGKIESGTSEVAASIAAEKFSFYCFEGLKRQQNVRLHITSDRFDEPRGLRLVEASEIAIGVHGRRDSGSGQAVWLGGRNERLRDAIGKALERAGFRTQAQTEGDALSGRCKTNICNRGRNAAGVQLELPKSLREVLAKNAACRLAFGTAVRDVIIEEIGVK